MRTRAAGLAVLGATLAAASALAAPGDLDQGFGSGGSLTTDFGLTRPGDAATAILALPDGRLLVLGRANGVATADPALARYLPDGSLDPSFGDGDGRVSVPLPGAATIEDAALLGDGVAAGGSADGGDSDFLAARFRADGDLAGGFAATGTPPGVAIAGFTPGSDDRAAALAALPGGELVLAGSTEAGGEEDMALARFDANGILDPGFGSGTPAPGLATFDASAGADDRIADLAALGDGGLLAAATVTAAGYESMAVARFTSGGAPDPAYGGGDGVAALEVPAALSSAGFAIAVLPGGEAYVAGTAAPAPAPGSAVFALAKLTAAGTLDPAFGAGGIVTTAVPGGAAAEIRELAVDADGNVVAFGSSRGGSAEQVAARYLPDGSLDPLFGGDDGIATASFGSPATADAGTIAADGGLVAAGSSDGDFALSRFAGGKGVPPPPKFCNGIEATIVAKPGASAGTAGDDVIVAGDGSDAINAGAGNDVVCGGGANDNLLGGSGKDTLIGEGGPDRLAAGDGRDLVIGGDGNDVLAGAGGRDRIQGNRGRDRIDGGGGRDRCSSGPGKDHVKRC